MCVFLRAGAAAHQTLDSIYDELNFFVRGAAKFGALRCWMTNVGENACQGSQGRSELVHSSV